MTADEPRPEDFGTGRPILFRGGTVLSMDPAIGLLEGGDVLVRGKRIDSVGRDLQAPDEAVVVDATGGILMPGMVDTHRHMWQTALRGLGADWTLSQYFVFYYLNWGHIFRAQDIHAGNLLSAVEAIDAGVTTTVDWSHGLRTPEHADAAVEALRSVPGRFVLAYGNIAQGPWEWATSPDFRSFIERTLASRSDMLGLQLAFDVTGDAAFPEKAAFETARDLGLRVTTHAGVRGATGDPGIRLMWDHGFMTPDVTYVHASTLGEDSYQRIAASGGTVSVSAESEQNAGQGYPPTWRLRRHRIPASLSMDTSVWFSGDMFSAMRATLSADRGREHLEAHAQEKTVVHNRLRAREVVEWATIGGARALGMDNRIGSLTPGKQADLVLVKNDRDPAMFPLLHPYGHVVHQAGRGDVHTVLVDGKVVKYQHELLGTDLSRARDAVGSTVEHARAALGEGGWREALEPAIQEAEPMSNPYTYSTYRGDAVAGQDEESQA